MIRFHTNFPREISGKVRGRINRWEIFDGNCSGKSVCNNLQITHNHICGENSQRSGKFVGNIPTDYTQRYLCEK